MKPHLWTASARRAGVGVAGALALAVWSVPATAQPADSLTVTVVNETGGPLTAVLVYFLEEENLLPRRLEDGSSVEVRLARDGCLYNVFGNDRKTRRTFRRYGVDLCRDTRVTLTPEDFLPGGEAGADVDFARVLDVYLSRAPANFDGLVDLSDPPDAAEYDLRFYFPQRALGDTYFVRREDGRFALRLELATFDDRGEAEAAVPERCAWLESLPMATPLRREPGDDDASGTCHFVADPASGGRVDLWVGAERATSTERRTVVFALITGSDAAE